METKTNKSNNNPQDTNPAVCVGLDEPKVMTFVVSCIESLAHRHSVSAKAVYSALADRSDLICSYVVPSYAFLHTQDWESTLDNIDCALEAKRIILSKMSRRGTITDALSSPIQIRLAQVITMFAKREQISAYDSLRFFYHSPVYSLFRNGTINLQELSDDYIVEDLHGIRAGLNSIQWT